MTAAIFREIITSYLWAVVLIFSCQSLFTLGRWLWEFISYSNRSLNSHNLSPIHKQASSCSFYLVTTQITRQSTWVNLQFHFFVQRVDGNTMKNRELHYHTKHYHTMTVWCNIIFCTSSWNLARSSRNRCLISSLNDVLSSTEKQLSSINASSII